MDEKLCISSFYININEVKKQLNIKTDDKNKVLEEIKKILRLDSIVYHKEDIYLCTMKPEEMKFKIIE